MRTTVLWAKCLILLITIINVYSTGDVAHNGTEVEFTGLGPGNKSTEIEENNYINLTVRCNYQNVLHIKISYQHNNIALDLCKFSLKTVCDASDSSNATSHCKCLNNNTVQFLKKVNSSDSGLYTWKWRDGKNLDEQRDIFINVIKANTKTGNNSDDTASATTTTTTVCVLLTVVVMVTAGAVFWMRNKAECSIGGKDCDRYYRSRSSDHAVDNEVNSQTINTAVNPHSAVVIESTANPSLDPNYSDVIDAIHPDDPTITSKNRTRASHLNLPILIWRSHSMKILPILMNFMERRGQMIHQILMLNSRAGVNQLTLPNPVLTVRNSQPLDPYYSDIEEPSMSHDYDNNNTNDTEHDESHNYDPKYTDVKIEENSKADDPTYAHVKKRKMRHPDHSTDAQVETGDMIPHEDLFCDEVKKQNGSLAVDTIYPHNEGQDTEEERVYSPKNKQKPFSPHNTTYVQGKEDTTERGDFYNHLHEIHQHDDPSYDHIETKETAC
ncbi:uncharacterized protein LOC112569253 [Pomacea canaliculata]|nr:uncharacterized protein LOC112569253 [Pomacea canaliculata]